MIVEGPVHGELAASLHGAAFPAAERWDGAAMAALLGMPGCFACLSFADDQDCVGMALVRVVADEAELLTIAVPPPLRARGIGRTVLEEAMAEAMRRGARRMFLEAAVHNMAARALYGATGFEQVGQRLAYYPDGADALLLSRALA